MKDIDKLDPDMEHGPGVWRRIELPVLVLATLVCAILGAIGLAQYYRAIGQSVSLSDLAYQSFQLFGLEGGLLEGRKPPLLQVCRFAAPFITLLAVVAALFGIFRERVRALRQNFRSGHVVVCGVGRKAASLVRDFHKEHTKLVVIDPDPENPLLRACECAGAFVIHGDASRAWVLAKARVRQARHIFITTGNDNLNIEIASQLVNFVRAGGKIPLSPAQRPVCHIHLVDRQTTDLFKRHQVFQEAAKYVDIRTFNTFDIAARLLWRERLLDRCPLLPGDARRMHVVIGGLGQMGEAVLLRLARSGHFANGRRIAVTIADREAVQRKERLCERYPMLPQLCDLGCLDGELDSPATLRRIAELLKGPDQVGTVVLCLDHDYTNFAIALRMAQHLGPEGAQVYVRLSEAAGLCDLLEAERSEATLAKQIDGFGLIRRCCAKETILTSDIDAFARSFHAAYIRGQLKAGQSANNPKLKPWDDLSEEQREANREVAEHLEVKLRTYGFTSAKGRSSLPEAFAPQQELFLAIMEHNRWCAVRGLAGWTYAPGPEDPKARTSPDLRPWSELSEAVQRADYTVVRAIPAMLKEQR